jgi:signal transduction histidine kinase
MVGVDRWERYAVRRIVAGGRYVFEEGDPSDEMFIVAQGRVMIVKDAPGTEPVLLGYRNPGDIMGELSLLNDSPRTASALALDDTELLAISCDDFWQMMRNDQSFQNTVISTLVESLLKADTDRQAMARWEYDVLVRFSALSSEHARLAEILQLRKEMVNFIVHDLRSPLGLIAMCVAMLEIDIKHLLDEDQAEYLRMAHDGVDSMLTLIDAILDLERFETGTIPLNRAAVDLADLASNAVRQIQPMAQAKDITVSCHTPSAPYWCMADSDYISRVFTNLLDNALKFTPSGGEIAIKVWREGQAVLAAVSDNGPGIPPEYRERIFTRFAQTEEGRKARGFGLGLAFCRAAIQAHDGAIRAEGGLDGTGSSFVFSLPAGDTQP